MFAHDFSSPFTRLSTLFSSTEKKSSIFVTNNEPQSQTTERIARALRGVKYSDWILLLHFSPKPRVPPFFLQVKKKHKNFREKNVEN